MAKLRVWLDSGANIESCNERFFEFEDIGMTEREWDELSEGMREDIARELAFEDSDWGFCKVADNEE